MSTTPPTDPGAPPLNPALREQRDESHGTDFAGTDPMETVSVKDPNEGRSWPVIWAVVFLVCLGVTIYLLV